MMTKAGLDFCKIFVQLSFAKREEKNRALHSHVLRLRSLITHFHSYSWLYCSFTSLKCRWIHAFLFNFCLSNTTCSLRHGHFARCWGLCCSIFGSDSNYLCIHLTFARSISASPHSFSDARRLSVSFGYHCLTKTKVGVQAGWGLPRRQISLTIYLHSLYFPLMWVGEGGQQRPQSPRLYNNTLAIRVLHHTLWFHPIRRNLRASLQSPAGKTHPGHSCFPGHHTHGCSQEQDIRGGRVAPRPATAMVIHSPCIKKLKALYFCAHKSGRMYVATHDWKKTKTRKAWPLLKTNKNFIFSN